MVRAEAVALACELPTRALPARPARPALPAAPVRAALPAAPVHAALLPAPAKVVAAEPGAAAPTAARGAAGSSAPVGLRPGGAGLSRWDAVEIARELIAREVVGSVSAATVRRWLAADALKPWQHRSWLFPRDPAFAAKGGRVLDLYQRRWCDRELGDGEFVVSVDEKTSIQPRCRCHPTLPPAKARAIRVEHEYVRGGALAYLAAYDVHRAQVSGRCELSTGIDPFHRLVDQLMAAEPYASAETVYLIADNGSSHRGKASVDRVAGWYPNVVLVHTPVHASWLNQVEIYFSIVENKALAFSDFDDLDAAAAHLLAFEERFNATATPFNWKFTRNDLDAMLRRMAAHDPQTPKASAA
ncbi:MAG: IS630 family transposase [Actinobacteria bacterium]|nr:IS630 family transposase [Actinomycetota bacterium]